MQYQLEIPKLHQGLTLSTIWKILKNISYINYIMASKSGLVLK